MGNLRKIVGVALAVAVVAGVMVYLLIPKSGTTTNNVVVNEPQTPTNGGSGSTPTGGSGTGGSGSGSTPSPQTPPSRPPKAHGQNSNGPKHMVCLPEKNHEGNGVSQYQGANQYRGECPVGAAQGSQIHGQGHGHATNAVPQVVASPRLLHAAAASAVHGNR